MSRLMSRNLSRPVQGGLAEVEVGDEPAEDAHGEAAQLAVQPGGGVAGDEASLQTRPYIISRITRCTLLPAF